MSIYIQQRTWVVDILSHCVWKQNIGCPCCDQFLVLVMPLKYFIWMIQQITTVCFLFKSCCSKEYKNTKKDTFNLVTFHMLQLPLLNTLPDIVHASCSFEGHWKFCGMGMCLRPLHIECKFGSAVVVSFSRKQFLPWKWKDSICSVCVTACGSPQPWKIQFVASASRLAV